MQFFRTVPLHALITITLLHLFIVLYSYYNTNDIFGEQISLLNISRKHFRKIKMNLNYKMYVRDKIEWTNVQRSFNLI